MISPHTSPGTEIVAVKNVAPKCGLPGLLRGSVYIVAAIHVAAFDEPEKFAVELAEQGLGARKPRPWWQFWRRPQIVSIGYSLSLFRYLDRAARPEFYTQNAPLDIICADGGEANQ